MTSRRDPIDRAADDRRDLYGIVRWEPRSTLDRFATWLHAGISPFLRATLVAIATVVLVATLASGLGAAITNPTLRILVVISAVPALLLAVYIWYVDVASEPLTILAGTFILGLLFAPFAGIANSAVQAQLASVGIDADAGLSAIPYFFLVVALGEESVKLLAVRVYAFHDRRFDAVLDGAVYGAAAGLGFALIENALYITSEVGLQGVAPGSGVVGVAALRALAGPGHVIYSGIAGYYLGLAKFNREYAGPLIVKGILVAAAIHATYNVLVGHAPLLLMEALAIGPGLAVIGFILLYDGVAGYVLYRKISGYRRTYTAVYGDGKEGPPPEPVEFDDASMASRERDRSRGDRPADTEPDADAVGRGSLDPGERETGPTDPDDRRDGPGRTRDDERR